MYPLKFEPILKTMIWGGEKIAPYKGIRTDLQNIGESWELSGVKGNESVVSNGIYAGKTIAELVATFKGALVGEKVYASTGDEFPLLIKFIDAKSDLSIQVHPDDSMAAVRHNGSKGKTEMWYVVEAENGASLLSGFSKEIGPQEYEAMVESNSITDVLARHQVKEGDVFFLPAGRVHAIGAGVFIAEIQQTSDITYRIYDYGRIGKDGKPRELHTALAKDAIDFKVYPDYRSSYEREKNVGTVIAECKYFTTSLLDLDRPFSKNLSGLDSFLVVICVDGCGKIVDIEDDREEHVFVRKGETVLIPASSSSVSFIPDGAMKLLTSHID